MSSIEFPTTPIGARAISEVAEGQPSGFAQPRRYKDAIILAVIAAILLVLLMIPAYKIILFFLRRNK